MAGGVSSEFRKKAYPHALFYVSGEGARTTDVDGNEYLDFTLSQGPLILGHSHPVVLKAVTEYVQKGQLFAGQHIRELELAEKLQTLIPAADLLRFCLDGSEAVQTALRVARAVTGRNKFLRFEGHYHGWMDNVCWGISAPSADALGPREAPRTYPWTEGLPADVDRQSVVIPWNDLDLVERTLAEHYQEIGAIITEPVMCNNGCILPVPGYLEGLRKISDHYGIALIFDEVITGFRVGLGGAQQYFGVTPDLAIFGKAMASGFPISAIVGQKKWMKVIEESRVIHAGTMNAGSASVAAALATIQTLESESPYDRLFSLGQRLMKGLGEAAASAGIPVTLQGPGPMFHIGFTSLRKITDYRDCLSFDNAAQRRFIGGMHDHGVRIIGRGLWYISTVHSQSDIDQAISVAGKVLKSMNSDMGVADRN